MPIEYINNSVTFDYTKREQTFTVPDGVTSVSVDAYGAKGGSISNYSGGRGGQVTTNLTVTPGETLYIRVGQYVGQKYSQIFAFGGGGAGHLTLKSGSTGGGATHISRREGALNTHGHGDDNILVVAGGGGAGSVGGTYVTFGGAGGGLVGKSGQNYKKAENDPPQEGRGGTQNSGGLGGEAYGHDGWYIPSGSGGALGLGGYGAGDFYATGGGGGYYGGGIGVDGSAGGGGSSYTHPTLAAPLKVGEHWPLFLSKDDADNNSSDGNSKEIPITGDTNGMNSLDDEVRYWKPNTYTGSFTESQMTVHAQGVQNQHGQLILEWSEPKKQQYTISGTNVTGGELSVEKDGDNIIPSGDDQYTTYQWEFSDGTNWTNITWASIKLFPTTHTLINK